MATSYENKQSSKANKQVCVPAAVNTHSSQLLSCSLYLGISYQWSASSKGLRHSSCFSPHPWHSALGHSLQMPVLIFNFAVLLYPHESSVKLPGHTNLLSANRIPGTQSLLLPILTNTEDQFSVFTAVSMHSAFPQVYGHRGWRITNPNTDTAAEILHSLHSHHISQHLILEKKTDTTLLLVCEYWF